MCSRVGIACRDCWAEAGMAEVYLAQDGVLGRPVAVKVFPSGTNLDADAKRQRHEAELLASLNHPGLVTVFDAGVDPDQERSFLVMEFVGGPTLAARLAAGPIGEAQVRAVGASLAESLAYVHQPGVVHRDVKPSNVLFADAEDYEGVKLADFGIARMADSARLTQAGLIVGSAHYLSPDRPEAQTPAPGPMCTRLVLFSWSASPVNRPSPVPESPLPPRGCIRTRRSPPMSNPTWVGY